MSEPETYVVLPIGVVRSSLQTPAEEALHRIEPGDELIVLTWLHLADRDVLQIHQPATRRSG